MEALQCIGSRRSVRLYDERPVSKETINRLLELGVAAASGSNQQPWGFVVVQNRDEIKELADLTKATALANLSQTPYLQPYEEMLRKENTNLFFNAGTLLIIYGDTHSHWYLHDGTLATANIMLAAHSMGMGTCWIGFAEKSLNSPAIKARYNIPEHFELVCPLTLGYITKELSAPKRKAPVVFKWSE